MPDHSAEMLGENLVDAVVRRVKEHDTWGDLLTGPPPSTNAVPAARSDSGDLRGYDELEILAAFIASWAVTVAFASNPQYKSEVLREIRTQYLQLQDDRDRSAIGVALEDRFARYERALSTRRPNEAEEEALANAFAEVCGRNDHDFCSVAGDLVAEELIVMRAVMRGI